MIDWFIVLTPILLLPIAICLFFLGCGYGVIGDPVNQHVEITFVITFYLDNDSLGHSYEFKILDSLVDLDNSVAHTDDFKKVGGPGESVQGTYQFTRFLTPGAVDLTSEVRDLNANGDDGMPLLWISAGAGCEIFLENLEQYTVEFTANVDADGTPIRQFNPC